MAMTLEEKREKNRLWRAAWRAANLEKVRAQDRAWTAANQEKARANQYRYKGLPQPTRPMPDNCECCGRPRGEKGLALDHCHISTQFRGWLCTACNTAMGKFGDDIAGLMKAVRYLERTIQLKG